MKEIFDAIREGNLEKAAENGNIEVVKCLQNYRADVSKAVDMDKENNIPRESSKKNDMQRGIYILK